MSDSQYNARTVRAILEIGKVRVPVSSVTLRHTIDELPFAEIFIQLDNAGEANSTVDLNLKKFQQMCVLFQEYVFNNFRIKPNAHLYIEDGNDHYLHFHGFIGQPRLVLVNGTVTIMIGMVHAKAALQAFNAQIYNHNARYVMPFLIDAFESDKDGNYVSEAAKRIKHNYPESVSLRILAIIEYMHANPYLDGSPVRPIEFDSMPIHLLNTRSIDLVREVLIGSEKTTTIPGIGSEDFFEESLRAELWMGQVNAPNFLTSLAYYNQMFLFQTNADWEGNLWMERIQTLDDPENRVIQVPTQEMRFDCAHLFELPLLQVIVTSAAMNLYVYTGTFGTAQGDPPKQPIGLPGGQQLATENLAGTGDQWNRLPCLAKYPDLVNRNAVGNFYVLQAPNWINPDVLLDTYSRSLYQQAVEKKDTRFMLSTELMKAEREKMQAANPPRVTVLNYLARQYFQSIYLGKTAASLTIPYDIRPCVGRTYRIKDMAGNDMFVGFLREVHHSITLSADQGSAAYTVLSFSHIRMAGAKLDQLLKTVTDSAPLEMKTYDTTYLDTSIPGFDVDNTSPVIPGFQ